MTGFEAKQHGFNEINGGQKYNNGDGVHPDAINIPIENSAYAVEYVKALGTTKPDVSEAGNIGTPFVDLVDDGKYKKFKFANLKGEKGDKGETGATGENGATIKSAAVDFDYHLQFTLTDGTIVTTTGNGVRGPQGPQGPQGPRGNTGNGAITVSASSSDGMHFTATTEGDEEIKENSVGTMIVFVPKNSSSSLTTYLSVNGLPELPIFIDAEGSEYIVPNSTGWIVANKPMLMFISETPLLGMHWSAITNEASSLYKDKQWFIDTFYSASRGGGNVYIQANGMVNAKQKTFNISGTIRLVGVTTTDPNYALITPAQLNTILRNASTSETVKVKSAMGNWIGTLKDANLTQYGTKMFLNTTDGLKITRIHTTGGSMGAWSLSQIMNNVTGGIIMFTLFGEIE